MIEDFLQTDGACAVGSYQSLYLNSWSGEATLSRLTQVREHRKQFLARVEGPIFSISLLYQTKLKLMPKESRLMVEEINRDANGRFVGEAYYVKAGGLLISSVRFLLAGLRLVNRLKTPLEVFGDLPGAVHWLAAQSKLSEEDLRAAVEEFTRRSGQA